MAGHGGADVRRKLEAAVVVERATGVVMQLHACGSEAARDLLVEEAGLAGRGLADHWAQVLARVCDGGVESARPTVPPVREHLVTADPQQVRHRLARLYGAAVRMSPPPPGARFRLRHADAGVLRTGDDLLPGDLLLSWRGGRWIVAAHLLEGSAEKDAGVGSAPCRFVAGDVFLLSGRPGSPQTWRTVDARIRTLAVPAPLVHRGADTPSARFADVRPASPALARDWRGAAAILTELLDNAEATSAPVLVQVARMTAAMMLAVFPTTAHGGEGAPAAGTDVMPATVRAAVRFIRRVLAATDTHAASLAELEFSLGEGPGLDAAATGTPVLVEDLAGAEGNRWPVLAAQVTDRKLPVRAVFAYPLQMNAESFGFLEVHRDRPGRLDHAEREAARIAADLAGFALVQSLDAPGVGELSIPVQLADPDLDGVEVDQAVGMVMAQLRAPADVALSMLRARAFAEGRTLGDVATDVVGRRISFRTDDHGDQGG